MPGEPSTLIKDVERLYGEGTLSGLSESQLLERFLVRNDELAFEALVTRHGPMVLSVCRRILRDDHAADDAFQATFLVLVRRAGSIRSALLGPWLHRVAYRVAIRAGKRQSRRSARESLSSEALASAASPSNGIDRESLIVLHEALEALPARYREPIVLCDLEGQTHDEAARQLQWPIGSVKGRLSRGRDLLKSRLERRGVGAPAVVLAAFCARQARASISRGLQESTVRAAIGFAARDTAAVAAGAFSASASLLAQEVVRAMIIKKWTSLAACLLVVTAGLGGAAALARQEGATPVSRKAEVVNPAVSVSTPPEKTDDSPKGAAPGSQTAKPEDEKVKTGLQVAQELRDEVEKLQFQKDVELDRVTTLEQEIDIARRRVEMLEEVISATELFELTGVSRPPAISVNNKEQREGRIKAVHDQLADARKRLKICTAESRQANRKADEIDRQIDKINAKAAAAADRPGLPNTVQVGDILVVEVLEALPGRPISGERIVRPDGTISLGFYGDLKVDGLTLREIKVKVIEHMQKYLTDEALGLIQQREVKPNEFEEFRGKAVDSDRVFVDQANWAPARNEEINTLRRKLDDVVRELDALKAASRRNRGRPE